MGATAITFGAFQSNLPSGAARNGDLIALSPDFFSLVGHKDYAPLALLLAALIVFMHRENIRRLLAGKEPRIGAK